MFGKKSFTQLLPIKKPRKFVLLFVHLFSITLPFSSDGIILLILLFCIRGHFSLYRGSGERGKKRFERKTNFSFQQQLEIIYVGQNMSFFYRVV